MDPIKLLALMSLLTFFMIGLFLMLTFQGYQRAVKEIKEFLLSPQWIEILGLLSKITWRVYFESQLRAQSGKVLERPFGTPLHFYSWDRILIQPWVLSGAGKFDLSLELDVPFDTSVILGPKAQKPLKIDYPLLIGGMSYGGALSEKAKIALAKAATMLGTATNSGSGPLLKEEREFAKKTDFSIFPELLGEIRGGFKTG